MEFKLNFKNPTTCYVLSISLKKQLRFHLQVQSCLCSTPRSTGAPRAPSHPDLGAQRARGRLRRDTSVDHNPAFPFARPLQTFRVHAWTRLTPPGSAVSPSNLTPAGTERDEPWPHAGQAQPAEPPRGAHSKPQPPAAHGHPRKSLLSRGRGICSALQARPDTCLGSQLDWAPLPSPPLLLSKAKEQLSVF